LRDREHRAAHIGERELQLAALIVEDPQAGDLGRETLAVAGAVRRTYAEEDDQAAPDLRDALVADGDRCRPDALNDRARLAHSSIHGLSPRTTDSTSLAERWPGAQTVMLFPRGSRVMYVTLPKR
jgi:hypothetical protein